MDCKDIPKHLEDCEEDSEVVVAWKFRRCNRLLRRTVEKRVAITGVYDSQHRILITLYHEPNICQKEIAKRMGISPASVAVSIKKLEKAGYLKKNMDETDNRLNKVVLTDKGMEVVKKSHIIFAEIDRAMFKDFSEEDMAKATEILDRIKENIKAYCKEKDIEEGDK